MSRAIVDGVVAIGLSDDHPEVEEIRRAGVPIVLVDSTALPDHDSIEVDDVGGARAAAEHVIALGHRDILIIGVEPPLQSRTMEAGGVTGRRLRGYREAFAAVGVEIPDERIVVGPASIDGGIAALDRAWEDGLRPTAVLAMSDAMAIGAMRALRDMRLTVPGDVSVVGFDDIDLAQHVDPPLTTVHQPIRRKGEEAVRLLLTVVATTGSGQARASPARDATHRPRLDRSGAARTGGRWPGTDAEVDAGERSRDRRGSPGTTARAAIRGDHEAGRSAERSGQIRSIVVTGIRGIRTERGAPDTDEDDIFDSPASWRAWPSSPPPVPRRRQHGAERGGSAAAERGRRARAAERRAERRWRARVPGRDHLLEHAARHRERRAPEAGRPPGRRLHPGITVKTDLVPFDGADKKYTDAANAGTAPDIFRADIGWTPTFADAGHAARPDQPRSRPTSRRSSCRPRWGRRSTRAGCTASRRSPTRSVSCATRAVLTTAGLTAAPTTWDELVSAGTKVTDLAAQKYGFYMRGDSYWSQPFIWGWGGTLFTVNDQGKVTEIGVNSPESVSGWTYLKDKVLGTVAPATWDFKTDYDNMNAGFKAGTIMCILQGPWQVADILTGDGLHRQDQPRHRPGPGRRQRQDRLARRRSQLGRQRRRRQGRRQGGRRGQLPHAT